ncbi:hypothetical protein OF83DRAFT_1180051 [Amylostereum chailletii]|nr:hypothetical protein OF83DRAFT_1180051 [Amylostereum chailletii]
MSRPKHRSLIHDSLVRYAGPSSPATALCLLSPYIDSSHSYVHIGIQHKSGGTPAWCQFSTYARYQHGIDIFIEWAQSDEAIGLLDPSLPLNSVINLHIALDRKGTPKDWRPLLRRLTSVRRIKGPGALLWGMLLALSNASPDKEGTCLAPFLEELIVLPTGQGLRSLNPLPILDMAQLVEFLKARAESGTPILKLCLPERYASENLADEISRIVSHMDWADVV